MHGNKQFCLTPRLLLGHTDKTPPRKASAAAIIDNRAEAATQAKLIDVIQNTPNGTGISENFQRGVEIGPSHGMDHHSALLSGRPAIQRMIAPVYNTDLGVRLNPRDQQKINDLVQTLVSFGASIAHNLLLTINIDNNSDTNPADTIPTPAGITINIRHWVIRNSDIGFILGLIVHELGAHFLADMEMTGIEKTTETQQNPVNFQVQGYTLTQVPSIFNIHHRQQDHINAAKLGVGLVGNSARAMRYIDTLVRMGNSVITNSAGAAPVNELQELLKTCLFDLARIIVDNDKNRAWLIAISNGQRAAMAEIMNWIYGQITAGLPQLLTQPVPLAPGGSDWITALGFRETADDLYKYLGTQLVIYLNSPQKDIPQEESDIRTDLEVLDP